MIRGQGWCGGLAHRAALVTATLVAVLCVCPAPAARASSGALDPSFGSGGVALVRTDIWAGAGAVAVQPNGKIVAVGIAYTGSQHVLAVVRLLRNGRVDQKFGRDGWVQVALGNVAFANALAIQPDGRIVIAGTGMVKGRTLRFVAVRLLRNGKRDRSFGRRGIASVAIGRSAIANAVAVRPNGKIVLGGTALLAQRELAVAQLTGNGRIDRRFGDRGATLVNQLSVGWGMVLQPDGSVVVGGQAVGLEPGSGGLLGGVLGILGIQPPKQSTNIYMAARVRSDGKLDPGFGQDGIATVAIGKAAVADAIALQPDGRIVLSGDATMQSGAHTASTVRLLPSGAPDPSFGSGGIASYPGNGVNAVALQPDGKIVLAGVGASAVRLLPSGAPDYSFGRAGAFVRAFGGGPAAANGVAIQRDGKIVLAGIDTTGGYHDLMVIRLMG